MFQSFRVSGFRVSEFQVSEFHVSGFYARYSELLTQNFLLKTSYSKLHTQNLLFHNDHFCLIVYFYHIYCRSQTVYFEAIALRFAIEYGLAEGVEYANGVTFERSTFHTNCVLCAINQQVAANAVEAGCALFGTEKQTEARFACIAVGAEAVVITFGQQQFFAKLIVT